MIGRLLGILGALILAGWLYWLTARVQILISHAEATLQRADRTLTAAVASIAAPPTPAESTDLVPPNPAPPAGPPPADGPPTVPTGMALELEKRTLVERAFPVHGAPRRFTFKTSDDGAA